MHSSQVGSISCIRRVKEHCIHRGYSWSDSMAKAASPEGEYYEDLLEYYMQNYRVRLPCKLSDSKRIELDMCVTHSARRFI